MESKEMAVEVLAQSGTQGSGRPHSTREKKITRESFQEVFQGLVGGSAAVNIMSGTQQAELDLLASVNLETDVRELEQELRTEQDDMSDELVTEREDEIADDDAGEDADTETLDDEAEVDGDEDTSVVADGEDTEVVANATGTALPGHRELQKETTEETDASTFDYVEEEQKSALPNRAEFVSSAEGSDKTDRVFKGKRESNFEDPFKALLPEDGSVAEKLNALTQALSGVGEKQGTAVADIKTTATDIRQAVLGVAQGLDAAGNSNTAGSGSESGIKSSLNGFGANTLKDLGSAKEGAKTAKQLPKRLQDKIIERIQQMLQSASQSKSGATMVVRLDPPELGAMSVKVMQRGDQLYARVVPESSEVELRLRHRSPELLQVLAQTGINPENIHISFGEERTDADMDFFREFFSGESAENGGNGFSEGDASESGFSGGTHGVQAFQTGADDAAAGWVA